MGPFSPIADSLRHLNRYREILETLVAAGLADIVQELGLDRLLERGLSFIRRSPAPEIAASTRPQRVRRAMEQLGPTFIKMGQVLSTRPDLIPEAYADEFARLQAECPKLQFEEIRAELDRELGDQVDVIFRHIDSTPLAAASIAQTHAATLADGTDVVLKIRRPGIDEVTRTDIEILRTLARIVESRFSNLGYSPTEVVNEFARELAKEIDFTLEGRSTDRLAESFKDDPQVVFPRVHWDATTKCVLTIDRIHGTLLSNLKPEQMTPEERRGLVTVGARAVMRQTMELGFFHADPHPGNLIAMDNGRIAFIDCGMTGQLDRRTRELLADLVHGVVSSDADKVVRVVGELGDVEPRVLASRALMADVRDFIGHFAHTPLDRLDLGRVLLEFFEKLRAHHLRCPGDLVLLIKALTTIEGVASKIDPGFDLMSVAQPYVEKLVRERYGVRAIRQRLQNMAVAYTQLAERLPADLKQIVDSVNRERLTINLEHHRLDKLTDNIEQAGKNISWALVIASLFVGSAIMVLADKGSTMWGLSTVGLIGFLAAGAMVIVRYLANRFRK